MYISRLLQKKSKSQPCFVIDLILIPILLFVSSTFFLENLKKKESSCHVVMDLLNLEPCPILVAPSDFSTNFYRVSNLNIINKRNLSPEESAHTMVPKPSMPLMAQLLTPHVLIKIHMKSHLLRHFVIIPRLSSISQVIFASIFAIQFLEKVKILEYSSALVFSFSCFLSFACLLTCLANFFTMHCLFCHFGLRTVRRSAKVHITNLTAIYDLRLIVFADLCYIGIIDHG